MGLFAPLWQSKDKEKALKAVKGIKSQNKLFRIALSTAAEDVRRAAVENMYDKTLLKQLISTAQGSVLSAACKALDEPSYITELLLGGLDFGQKISIVKVIEEELLAKTAIHFQCLKALPSENEKQLYQLTIHRINRQDLLFDLVKNAKEQIVREQAAKSIVDLEWIHKVIDTLEETAAHRIVVENIKDPAVLNAIALHHESKSARAAAIDNVQNQSVIETIIKEDPNEHLRYIAALRCNNQYLCAQFIMTATDSYSAKRVLERINDQTVLSQMISSGCNVCMMPILYKITDLKPYEYLAYHPPVEIAFTVIKRLYKTNGFNSRLFESILENTTDPTLKSIAASALQKKCYRGYHLDYWQTDSYASGCGFCGQQISDGDWNTA